MRSIFNEVSLIRRLLKDGWKMRFNDSRPVYGEALYLKTEIVAIMHVAIR